MIEDLIRVYGPASLASSDVAWVLSLLRARARRMTGPSREAEVADGIALAKALNERLPDRPTIVAAVRVLDRFMTRVRSALEFVSRPSCPSCMADLFLVVDGAPRCALCDRIASLS